MHTLTSTSYSLKRGQLDVTCIYVLHLEVLVNQTTGQQVQRKKERKPTTQLEAHVRCVRRKPLARIPAKNENGGSELVHPLPLHFWAAC